MKYLVILNRRFPYKYGEAFMENEIEEISPYFDKILIFPSDMKVGDPITRNIKANNVVAYACEKHSLKVRNCQNLLNGLRYLKDDNAKTVYEKLYGGYFRAAAYQQADNVYRVLAQYNFRKTDQVILYSYWLFINAKVAVLLKEKLEKVTNVKCISRAHAFDIYEENKYLPERMLLLEKLDAIYPCSKNGTEYLKKKYEKYSNKVSTSYLGTYNKGVVDYRRDNTFRIVSCSRIAPEKRVDYMVECLACLKDSGITFEWTHIGGGEGLDAIRKKASEELSFMKVNFFGSISNQEVYKHYTTGNYSLFLNTSSAEGLPVSIMEAISLGIPVVATSAGGTNEIVINDISGYIEKVDSEPKMIADDILKIAQMSEERYTALRMSARKLWEDKFVASKNYRQFVDEIIGL